MKRLIPSAILALTLVSLPALSAADSKPAGPTSEAVPAAKPQLAGQFLGKWKGSSEGTGDLQIKLKKEGEAPWSVESTFTFEGSEIPTKSKSVEVDGSKVKMVFDWEIQGSAGQSTLVGELVGNTLQGTFETSGAAGASKGTWTVTRS